jgi:hypothetical protein
VLEGRAERPALQPLRQLPRFPRAQTAPPYRSGSSVMFEPTARAPQGTGRSARQGQSQSTAAPRTRRANEAVVTAGAPDPAVEVKPSPPGAEPRVLAGRATHVP